MTLKLNIRISFQVFNISTLLHSERHLMSEEPSNDTKCGGTALLLNT